MTVQDIPGPTGSASQDSGSASQDLAEHISTLRGDIGKLTDTVASLVRNQADHAQQTVRSALSSAHGAISDTASQATRRVATIGDDIEASIGRNPLTAVLIAVGVGVVAGLIGGSRR